MWMRVGKSKVLDVSEWGVRWWWMMRRGKRMMKGRECKEWIIKKIVKEEKKREMRKKIGKKGVMWRELRLKRRWGRVV